MFTIKDIQYCCVQNKIKWSSHAATRIHQRGLTREDIIHCLIHGEIREEYPDYWLGPACLIFGHTINNHIIHVVVGLDEYLHIITAYYPNNTKFKPDMKTRKER